MIAIGYVGVADLIGAVEGEFGSEFEDEAGVYVAYSLIAGVPLGG